MSSSSRLTRSACRFQEWMACSSILAVAGVDRNLCWFEAQSLFSTTNTPAAETCALYLRAVGRPPTDLWLSSIVTILVLATNVFQNLWAKRQVDRPDSFNTSHKRTINNTLSHAHMLVELWVCSICRKCMMLLTKMRRYSRCIYWILLEPSHFLLPDHTLPQLQGQPSLFDCQGLYMFIVAAFELSVYIKYVACHIWDLKLFSASVIASPNSRLPEIFLSMSNVQNSYWMSPFSCWIWHSFRSPSLSLSFCLASDSKFRTPLLRGHLIYGEHFCNVHRNSPVANPFHQDIRTSWFELGVFWKVSCR